MFIILARFQKVFKQVTLQVWWNFEGVFHFVTDVHAVNSNLCSQQLQRLADALKTRYTTLAKDSHSYRIAILQHILRI